MSSPRLSPQLLAVLWSRLANLGAPITKEAAAGLTADQIEELTDPEGITPPPEVITWWGWRNGTPRGVCHGDGFPGRNICPGQDLIPLQEALWHRRLLRQTAEDTAESDVVGLRADDIYPSQWLPLIRWSGSYVVADCSSTGPLTPLHYVSFGVVDNEDAQSPVAPSIGRMVTMWIEAIDAGWWSYDPDHEYIVRDWRAMPEEWRRTGFM